MRRTVKDGDRGEDVFDLQQQLYDLGYLDEDDVAGGVYTATFDAALYWAVIRFQRKHDLDETGVCDSTTWAAIEKAFDEL